VAVNGVAAELGGPHVDAYEIADHSLFINLNSDAFTIVSIASPIPAPACEPPARPPAMCFTAAASAVIRDDTFAALDPHLRMDVLRLARIVALPRQHATVLTNLEIVPALLVSACASLLGGAMRVKAPGDALLVAFHDAFVEAGRSRTHQYLLIEHTRLSADERRLLVSLLRNPNAFGLFRPGEVLEILTQIDSRGSVAEPYGARHSSRNRITMHW
jgi:hypothetical protein